jgi:hypothetical protein
MLRLTDLIPELQNEWSKYKVHMATSPKPDNNPLHAFFRGEFKQWQEWQNKKNFERPYILSLIYYQSNDWLYAGIYKSRSSLYYANDEHYEYDTELTDIRKDLIGRLVINFNKSFRASYLLLENYHHEFYVSEIMRERLSIQPFPGYENVNLDYNTLKTIIRNEDISWKTALRNIKGIYLITDTSNGKLYVGSVYGKEAFWTRWSDYVNSGHGNNIELKELLLENGETHVENFNFSILEIRSAITDDLEIQQRETHWKKVLLTRQFGYNKN